MTAVYPAEELDAEVDKVIATLVSGPAVALRKTKDAINAATLTELEAALEREKQGQLVLLDSTDFREGIRPSRSAGPPTSPTPDLALCRSDRICAAKKSRVRSRAGRSSRTRRSRENRWTRGRSVSDHRQVSTQFDIEQPVADAGGWRVLAPFRFREYRLLIAAVSLSIFAEGMWAVVMALQVIELDNDPASLSLVATCLGVGLVAFVLVGGIAADRISQRTIIIAVETVNVIAVSAIAVLGLVGALQIWHMAVAAARTGHRRGVLLPRLQRDPAADPAGRAAAGRQRRRRRRASGVPARRRSGHRRRRGRCDVPVAGRSRGGGAVRRRPDAAGGHRVRR